MRVQQMAISSRCGSSSQVQIPIVCTNTALKLQGAVKSCHYMQKGSRTKDTQKNHFVHNIIEVNRHKGRD